MLRMNHNFGLLLINVSKSKEMLLDFRSSQEEPRPIDITGTEVARVEKFEYLGITIDQKLNWHDHIDTDVKKLNTRMFCLHKLVMFYNSVVASVWRNCLICWGPGQTKLSEKQEGLLVLHSVETVYDKELCHKLKIIMDDQKPHSMKC